MESPAENFILSNLKNIPTNKKHSISESEKEEFLALFPVIVSGIVNGPKFASVPDIANRVKRVIEYNSAGGSKARGLMTVSAYKILEDPEKITDETMRLAGILGWCVELTSLVLLDDMADKSTSRRGSQCWYRLPDVGLLAMGDSLLLLTVVFDILKDNFSDRSCYPEMLYTFNEALRHLCIGQYDSAPRAFNEFTIENFKKYSNHRRTYYTFKLPINLSLFLTNKHDKNIFDNVEDILVEMGLFLSMQNDYADCFGDESQSGKAGTDIQEGKCSWLAVQALARCSAAQRAEFEASYGVRQSCDGADEAKARVRRIYERLQLPALYRRDEQAAYRDIVARIQKLPTDSKLPPVLLLQLFKMIQELPVD